MIAAPSALAQSTAQGAGPQLDEIVVTAQKRSQNAQDVPIAINVISAAALETRGLKTVEDLATVTPGLQIGNGAASLLPFLRGVGNNNTATGNEASIASYIDGVYFPVLPIGFFTFSNLERVEVLKGPQGTLFGRNSSGGVLHLITADPSHDLHVKANLGYGNYDTVQGDFYVTGGLSDTVSADLAVSGQNQGKGFGTNITTLGKNNFMHYFTARSKVLFEPSDKTRIIVSPFYTYSIGTLTTNTYPGTTAGYLSAPQTQRPTIGFYDSADNDPNTDAKTTWGGSLRIEQELGFAKLTSITAYSDSQSLGKYDGDISERPDYNARYLGEVKQLTQEFQLSSSQSKPLNWTVGAFYYYSDVRLDATIVGATNPFGPQGGSISGQQKTNSYSVYGQATYALTPELNITGGLRYSIDRVRADGSTTLFFDPLLVLPGVPAKDNVKKLSYKASVDFRPVEGLMVYATTSRGYKSGVYNIGPYDGSYARPETLTAYELGFKSDLLDRRLRLNAAGFYYDIKDPQVQILGTVGGFPVFSNADKARVYGAEFDAQLAVTSALNGRLAATWLNSKYKSYTNAPSALPIYTAPFGAESTYSIVDASGNYTVQAPKLTLNAGFDYVIEMASGKLQVSGDYFYNDGFYWEANNLLKQKAYSLFSGQISYSPTDTLTVRVWGKNLSNEKYTARTGVSAGPPGFPMVAAPPRTYGLSVGVKF